MAGGLGVEGQGPQQGGWGLSKGEGAASKREITWGGGIPCRETLGKEGRGLGRICAPAGRARGGRGREWGTPVRRQNPSPRREGPGKGPRVPWLC